MTEVNCNNTECVFWFRVTGAGERWTVGKCTNAAISLDYSRYSDYEGFWCSGKKTEKEEKKMTEVHCSDCDNCVDGVCVKDKITLHYVDYEGLECSEYSRDQALRKKEEKTEETIHTWRGGEDQDDLYQALQYNEECGLGVEDIEGILAEIPGANDELDWHWIVKLKAPRNGMQYVYICGNCVYTGWDCSSEISVCKFADSAMNATDFAVWDEISDDQVGRTNIRKQLQAQLNGLQPYATYKADFMDIQSAGEVRRAAASSAGIHTLTSSASVCMSSDEAPVKGESSECQGCEGKGWVENSKGMPFKCPLCGGNLLG